MNRRNRIISSEGGLWKDEWTSIHQASGLISNKPLPLKKSSGKFSMLLFWVGSRFLVERPDREMSVQG